MTDAELKAKFQTEKEKPVLLELPETKETLTPCVPAYPPLLRPTAPQEPD